MIAYKDKEYYTDAREWEYYQATDLEGVKTIQPGGYVSFTLPLSTASKHLRCSVVYNALNIDHTRQTLAKIDINYTHAGYKKDIYTVIANKDNMAGVDVENVAVLELAGGTVTTARITLYNKGADVLTIKGVSVKASEELQAITIGEVLKEDTIKANIIQMAGPIFSPATLTQYIRTNLVNMLVGVGKPGDVVDYITMQDWEMGFFTATLGTETEQLIIEYQEGGFVKSVPVWFTQITGDDAHKYYTTTNPLSLYPDMPLDMVEQYKVKIYTPTQTHRKQAFEFMTSIETGTSIPVLRMGAGIGEGYKGQAMMYKDETSCNLVYYKDNAEGGTIGLKIDNDGVHIAGLTDQHCKEIVFFDNGVSLEYVGEGVKKYEYIVDVAGNIIGYRDLKTTYQTGVRRQAGTI